MEVLAVTGGTKRNYQGMFMEESILSAAGLDGKVKVAAVLASEKKTGESRSETATT